MVERELARQPDLSARLSSLDVDMAELQKSAQAILDHAPATPSFLQDKVQWHWPWAAAAAVAAVAVGIFVGSSFQSDDQQNWVEAVANYQSLYVADTLAKSESLNTRAASLTSLSEPLGVDISPLTNVSGIDYRRAQMLGFEGQPLVQIAYLDNDVPIAICITLRQAEDSPVQEGIYYGLSTAFWQKDGRGYMVIGGQDAALIRQVAKDVQAKL